MSAPDLKRARRADQSKTRGIIRAIRPPAETSQWQREKTIEGRTRNFWFDRGHRETARVSISAA
jgi:hypothetical protein